MTNRRKQTKASARRQQKPVRAGFTLIELLVVDAFSKR
ncbi:MAG TPA: prepilin-type N-terminal cleavage/methylation domain-containing protein [Candidatus Binatia bacterium]|jgi:type II secretory pathway pseudopilin PulG|nr:prepilin-type N-terminal cleavage/methylation domain-containing protein [Candidatus Binatia bacterium]